MSTPEAPKPSGSRRTQLIVLAVFGAVLLIAIAIIVSQSGSDDEDEPATPSGDVQALIEGLPQDGDTIGEADAPATILEFADLQCPFCADFATGEIPTLLEGPVSAGDAKIQFRNWVILGPDSEAAAAAALAAGEQDRMWNFIEAFYADQGAENSGYVTDDFLLQIAETAGIPDIEAWEASRDPASWTAELKAINGEATGLGFNGTPSFAVDAGQGPEPLPNASTAADLQQAIAGGG